MDLEADDFGLPRPKFIATLIQMLDDGVIQWSRNGTALLVTRDEVERTLTKYLRSNKYSSLVRQLNLYGFSKVADTKQDLFAHPLFYGTGVPVPGLTVEQTIARNLEQLAVIRRKTSDSAPEVRALRMANSILQSELHAARAENTSLRAALVLCSKAEQPPLPPVVRSDIHMHDEGSDEAESPHTVAAHDTWGAGVLDFHFFMPCADPIDPTWCECSFCGSGDVAPVAMTHL